MNLIPDEYSEAHATSKEQNNVVVCRQIKQAKVASHTHAKDRAFFSSEI